MSFTQFSTRQIEVLRQIELFRDLAPADLVRILEAASYRRVERGGFFFQQGDAAVLLYVLLSGQARLVQVTPEGQQVILRVVRAGDMFGGVAALGMGEYPASAEATDDCHALAWDGATMSQLLECIPRLAINALRLLAQRVQELQDRLREMATERVERRVARTLLRLVRQAGRKVDEGVLIDLPLSRQDLAEMTGATLYTVSRILSQWEQQGLVEGGRARVLIRSPHALVAIAEDLPPTPAS